MAYYRSVLLPFIASCFLLACHTDNKQQLSDNFSSGNLGKPSESKVRDSSALIQLDNDNHDDSLNSIPLWRNWWYFKLNQLSTQRSYLIQINDIFQSNDRGWEFDYTPIYSYDQHHWQRFDINEVEAQTTPDTNNGLVRQINIDKQYDKSTVYVARFYPYTKSNFDEFYQTLKTKHADLFEHQYIKRQTLGYSPVHHLGIDMLTITDPNVSNNQKQRIWIQARSHAAETGSSFVVEGIINWLMNDNNVDVDTALSHFIFNIVPFHNPDGIFDGNYRTNSRSQNLENSWLRQNSNPVALSSQAPIENQILNKEMQTLSGSSTPFLLALNLHSTQSSPERRAFFFPHFGPAALGYSTDEAELWNNSLRFINGVRRHYTNEQGESLIEDNPQQGSNSFVSKSYPESWWWANFGPKVMAVTMETTYEKGGYQQGYVTPDRLRNLGQALMESLLEYQDLKIRPTTSLTPITEMLIQSKTPQLTEDQIKN